MVQNSSFFTTNAQEVEKFNDLAHNWWQEKGSFEPLHRMNACRLSFIRRELMALYNPEGQNLTPLKSLTILDVGCGGGLLTEPLARMGATVTGLDASEKAIDVAKAHAQESGLDITYCQGAVESFVPSEFDVVCALEIIEHVDHPQVFLKACLDRLKPGGALIISTLDRTLRSYIEGIVMAEYLLRWAPRGTHDWGKFFKPSELVAMLRDLNASTIAINGMTFRLLQGVWSLVPHPQTNYILVAVKEK